MSGWICGWLLQVRFLVERGKERELVCVYVLSLNNDIEDRIDLLASRRVVCSFCNVRSLLIASMPSPLIRPKCWLADEEKNLYDQGDPMAELCQKFSNLSINDDDGNGCSTTTVLVGNRWDCC